MSGVYTEADLAAAVRGGVLDATAAQALRDFVARSRAPSSDEEQFRLLSGFNDIFVTIAAVLTLFALGWLGELVAKPAGSGLVAVAAWGLAEFFTRRRRMALPSIVLLLAFVGGVFGTVLLLIFEIQGPAVPGLPLSPHWEAFAVSAGLAALAAYGHWWRFRVPITVAAGVVAGLGAGLTVLIGEVPSVAPYSWTLFLIAGVGVFALAMLWDMGDRDRVTRRTDVAFWLHLTAAPLIVHPLFQQLGLLVMDTPSSGGAVAAIAIYVVLTVVALIIDRRALLVSALAYVVFAAFHLLRGTGSIGTSLAIAGLPIGGFLLLLSALWPRARAAIVRRLPMSLQARLPRV